MEFAPEGQPVMLPSNASRRGLFRLDYLQQKQSGMQLLYPGLKIKLGFKSNSLYLLP
jgi:hypothetical protein